MPPRITDLTDGALLGCGREVRLNTFRSLDLLSFMRRIKPPFLVNCVSGQYIYQVGRLPTGGLRSRMLIGCSTIIWLRTAVRIS